MNDTSFPRLALSVLSACYFSLAIGSLSVIGLLLPMREGLRASTAEMAILVSVFSLTYAVSSPLSQVVVGDWDRRRLIAIGLSAIVIGVFMAAAAQTYATVMAGHILMGVGAGLCGPMASAAAAALVAPERRGAALGFAFSGMTIASVLGIPTITWLGDVFGWRPTLWLVGGFVALNAVAVMTLVPDHARGARANLGEIVAVLTDRVLAPAISVVGWQMAAQFATYSVITVYLTERFDLPVPWLPITLAAFGTGGILGNILAARYADQLGADRIISLSLIGTLLSLVGLQLSGGVLWLGLLFGLLWPITALALFAPQQERLITLKPEAANLLLALNGAAIYLGLGLGSALAGLVTRWSGTDWLAAVSAALMVCGLAAYRISKR